MLDAYDTDRAAWFDAAVSTRRDAREGRRRHLRCARCGRVLTNQEHALSIAGRQCHVHTNPAGLTFRLRTFGAAPGCAGQGEPQHEHTWFPPHAWQIAVCTGCAGHCGWRFSDAGGDAFFALIEDRMREDGG